MSKYSFSIQNYHAIKEAHIDIDGLTVLAGINGSGKSTLSRWLYYLTNAMGEFEPIQKRYFINSLAREIEKVIRLFRPDPMGSKYNSYKEKMLAYRSEDKYDEDQLKNLFDSFVLQVEDDLHKYIEHITPVKERRLSYYLINEDKPESQNYANVIQNFISNCYELYRLGIIELDEKIESHLLADLEEVIQDEYEQYSGLPSDILFYEEGIPLIGNGSFMSPLSLRRAIYADSPMILSDIEDSASGLWGRFRKLLYSTNNRVVANNEKLQISIQGIIGGKIASEEDIFGYSQELHYLANNGVDIRIEEAATGIKSFAYISRLLENGWLDKETLLLIDEPEAHLHPQWIVEFARLLVLIHKELGTKIMIASHNPDMVAAIQSIATKEEVIDKTKFYLAERDKDTMTYSFVDKGTEIGDIFESFNVAMSRIEQYGTTLI